MALRGNLKDFSLPDVFQLVTFSRKTGVLRIVRADDANGSVWFREGDVFFASSNWHAEPLGERLVKAERITAQALKRALELRAAEPEDGRRLGRILMDEGYITEKVLEEFVSEQIQDTIFDLMRWDEGEFDFETMPQAVEEDIGLTVSIENVVMEGARRLEEWGRIKKKIPSTDVVFKMATAPGEGTFEISLKPLEWQLLLLIDATRTVADLARAIGSTDFDVARIVYGLFSAGLLEFATEEEIEHHRAERAERESKLAEMESKRREAEEKEARAALERESKLAEEARRREEAAVAERKAAEEAAAAALAQAAASATAEAEAAAVAEAEAAASAAAALRSEPEEEPEFLAGPAAAPTLDDRAVLDEFMGVLQQPPVRPSEPSAEAEPPVHAEPHVPAEEPAFMSAGAEALGELTPSSIEDLLGMEPVVPSMPEPVVEPEPAVESEQAVQPEPIVEPEPALGVEAAPAPEIEPEGERSFERDLMALGLGEAPADLLASLGVGSETAVQPAEPIADLGFEIDLEAPAEPMSEIEAAGVDSDLGDLDSLGLELPSEVPSQVIADTDSAEAPDFSALLESLDVDAVDSGSRAEEPAPVDAGFDADLLREEEPSAQGGVISTDPYLEDISIEGLEFSGGLNDELSALTGAARKPASRPQANVNPIPDNAGTLHRDTRVDKDTLLRIIEGIKDL